MQLSESSPGVPVGIDVDGLQRSFAENPLEGALPDVPGMFFDLFPQFSKKGIGFGVRVVIERCSSRAKTLGLLAQEQQRLIYRRLFFKFVSDLGVPRRSVLKKVNAAVSLLCAFLLTSLVSDSLFAADTYDSLSEQLKTAIDVHSEGEGLSAFLLPASSDYANIPQDPSNPVTREKVRLGQLLFHDTSFGTEGSVSGRTREWSCASCHHVGAGFKAGIPQGIGDGGAGFGTKGDTRRVDSEMSATMPEDDSRLPDVQPLASPAILNSAYQELMLWSGSFGNAEGGHNQGVPGVEEAGPEEILANTFGLSGLETQALAGTKVHRLRFDRQSVLQTNSEYRYLYQQAFPDGYSGYIPDSGNLVSSQALGAAKAIAAYERTILSNLAPFQKWLAGDQNAMTQKQLRGGLLFFGKAQCVGCHTGPALSSRVGAEPEQMFFSVGFNDFNPDHPQIHGVIDEKTQKGRGGFTGNEADNYKFKIPQLYNLADSRTLGHGASFRTVREVIEYKNRGVPENPLTLGNLDERFVPLGMSRREVDDLAAFVEEALYDQWLYRYVPNDLPSKACFPVADILSVLELGCVGEPVIETEPTCQYLESDADGDGWGWESGTSCRVVPGVSVPAGFAVTGHWPDCLSNLGDSEGDSWGWEYGRSCKVIATVR